MVDQTYSQPSIEVQLPVGSRVQLIDEVEVEKEDGEIVGSVTDIAFEDYVVRHSPDTALLEFEDSDMGLGEFKSRVEEADGILISRNDDVKHV